MFLPFCLSIFFLLYKNYKKNKRFEFYSLEQDYFKQIS